MKALEELDATYVVVVLYNIQAVTTDDKLKRGWGYLKSLLCLLDLMWLDG